MSQLTTLELICHHKRNHIRAFILFLFAVVLPSAHAAQIEELEDLLQARWFEIEIIVFERLDVLDVNSSETLAQERPRQWPDNLVEFGSFLEDRRTAGTATLSQLTAPSPDCLGYPDLPFPEPTLRRFNNQNGDNSFSDRPTETDRSEKESTADEEHAGEPDSDIPLPQNAPQITLTPFFELLQDVTAYEETLYNTSLKWLPNVALTSDVKAINRQRHLRPLIHRRWRQAVPERDNPQPIYFSSQVNASSPLSQSGFAKIEGYIAVTVGRYLHFAPMLWYHADNLGQAPVAFPANKLLPGPNNQLHMELSESRRLRSGDLHYLDHPKLGVIVRIDPITLPQRLHDQWAAIDEDSRPKVIQDRR